MVTAAIPPGSAISTSLSPLISGLLLFLRYCFLCGLPDLRPNESLNRSNSVRLGDLSLDSALIKLLAPPACNYRVSCLLSVLCIAPAHYLDWRRFDERT